MSMDETTVRKQLAQVKAELERNEEEREILLSLMRGYEGWLRLNAPSVMPLLHTDVPPKTAEGKTYLRHGRPSARGSVLQVMKEAQGDALHVKEILEQIRAMGAEVKDQNPEGMVDLMLYSLRRSHPLLRKVGPRTWLWAGNEEDSESQESETQKKGQGEGNT